MAAVGQDGNNQMFPIAYAVVEAETKESWQWFLNLLLEDLNNVQPKRYAFISDQQKGLVPAIQNLGNHVEQRLCVKHLYGNWSKKYPGFELKEVFWMAARATTVPAWERAMNRLKAMNKKAWKDMKDVPPAMWTRSHFKLDTQSDLQVNNMCEAFNRAILEYRDKPIITLLEGIKHYLTKRIG
ncbi:defensin/CCP-like protein, partial [Trifolium medium]|nr:defensin/CCP-like protein [Trifolium medium]